MKEADSRPQETSGGLGWVGRGLSTFNQTSKCVLLGGCLLARPCKNWMKQGRRR